jgi:hypothetical protein
MKSEIWSWSIPFGRNIGEILPSLQRGGKQSIQWILPCNGVQMRRFGMKKAECHEDLRNRQNVEKKPKKGKNRHLWHFA